MTDKTPSPGNTPGLPNGFVSQLLDSIDALNDGRELVRLLALTTRHNPADDMRAMSAGISAALDSLDACRDLLDAMQADVK